MYMFISLGICILGYETGMHRFNHCILHVFFYNLYDVVLMSLLVYYCLL